MRKLSSKDYDRFQVSQSFAKNFGLYGERVGCLSVATSNMKERDAVMSRLKVLARASYSNPPIHAARIVDSILGDEELKKEWKAELMGTASRIISMREGLVSRL